MRILINLLMILLTGFVASEYGAVYYVSGTGNDSNPGTEAQPWKTIQKAAETMIAGDSVFIKAGTYNERVLPQNSGVPGKYITYAPYPNNTIAIDGSGIDLPDDWGGLVDITEKSYIKISGLRIKNAGPHINNQGILVDKSSYIIIEHNYTYNTASSGIGAWSSSHITIDGNEVVKACNGGIQECITVAVTGNFEIKNNHVHHCFPGPLGGGEGIVSKDGSHDGRVYNNHVHDMEKLGIYVDAWDKHTYNIKIFNNIVHDIPNHDCYTVASERGGLLENINLYNNIGYNAGENGITVSYNGDVLVQPIKDITIINNTLYKNGSPNWGGGIVVGNAYVENIVIRNNIVSRNIYYQIDVEPFVPKNEVTIDHNLIDGFRDYADEVKGSDPVEGDPLFINASNGDFHIKSQSPAIDAASSQGAPARDFDGNERPQGAGYDIGAFEYIYNPGPRPVITISPVHIDVTALEGSTTVKTGRFSIVNTGTGTLDWTVSVDNANEVGWLNVNPNSGAGPGTVTAVIDPSGLKTGNFTGILIVSSANAINSPQKVTVDLFVRSGPDREKPFGSFDTPVYGSTVRGSIPITGWALDDVLVERVKIFRDPVPGERGDKIYIGDGAFVEGVRPDVESAFPGYPDNSRAGWGYMLLTNVLPNGGNGVFTLYAVVVDGAGNEVTLGAKTIICDNANAVKPFGAIDTPGQGDTISGKNYINWGWALTPRPNQIPFDGSTIAVYVDGAYVGHPRFNIYREDIAGLFPGYANSNGAVGYFSLDTTAYGNGVHTIYWTVVDSAGNTDGIGCRYFNIWNLGKSQPGK